MRLKPLQTTSICGCLVLPGVQWLSHRLTSSLKFQTTAPESLSQKPSIQILPSAEFFICGFDYEVNLIVQKQTHNCNLNKWLGNLVPKNNENEKNVFWYGISYMAKRHKLGGFASPSYKWLMTKFLIFPRNDKQQMSCRICSSLYWKKGKKLSCVLTF